MNKLQRRLRVLSDARMDDTAVEMDACERAREALETTWQALQDGVVTRAEARLILEAQRLVIEASDLSLELNLREQPRLDEFIAHLGKVPAEALALLPRLTPTDREAA